MYYGRKKGIIIGVVIAIVVALIAIITLFIVMKTDLFKSNKTLFWKYMTSAAQNTKMEPNTQLQDIEKMKLQSPYTYSGELTLNSNDETTNSNLEKIKLVIDGEVDKENNYVYANSKIEYANNSIFNLEYKNTDNIYALKSDEIASAYIGIRNENLNVLLQKLGIDTIIDVPDTITTKDYDKLFDFSNEELKNISNTYKDIILDSISEDSYSRQTGAVIQKDGVTYNTTSYRLDLTGTQISEILINILNTLKTDNVTLNLIATKAKILELEDEYTTVDGISSSIDSIIENIQEAEFSDISFVVYNYKGETIMREIIVKNEQKITIDNDSQRIKMTFEDLKLEPTYGIATIEIVNQVTTTKTDIVVKVNIDDEVIVELNIINIGSVAQGSIDTNCSMSITSDGETIGLEYSQTLEFANELENMQKLDETNCAILNDYSQEELTALIQALANQISEVIGQKMQMLLINNVENDTNNASNQNSNMFQNT